MTPIRTVSALLSKWRGATPFALLLTAAVLAAAPSVGASCNEDCKSEYTSALGDCRAQYEKGDEDLQDLEDCLVDTRGEYDDCIDDCTSLGAGGVVACASPDKPLRPVVFVAPTRVPTRPALPGMSLPPDAHRARIE